MSNFETDFLNEVYDYANEAHQEVNQVRKYSGEPYIVHPLEVAKTLEGLGYSSDVIAAALLHDVVEDTNRTLEDIESNFGSNISSLVEMVTDVSKPEDGNRKARKALDCQHLYLASKEGKAIKLADMLSNAPTIISNNFGFAIKWMAEAENNYNVVKDGNEHLAKKFEDVIVQFKNKLIKK